MKLPCDDKALKQVFLEARTFNRFAGQPVDDDLLQKLYNLLRWGPTAVNCQPGRFIFIKSPAAKERLKPFLSPGNVEKTMAAPVTVIVALDTRFYEFLPTQWLAYDARETFASNPELAEAAARRNGSLQGAYLIMAARMLGLDCGPMSGFGNGDLDKEFFPEGRFKSNFLVNMGYGDPTANYPRGPRLSFEEAARII